MHSRDRRSFRDQQRAHSVRTSRRDSDRSHLAVRERQALWREYERSFVLLCVVIAAISDFYSSLAITNMGKGHCSPEMRENFMNWKSFCILFLCAHAVEPSKKSERASISAAQQRSTIKCNWDEFTVIFGVSNIANCCKFECIFHSFHILMEWAHIAQIEKMRNTKILHIRADDWIGYSEFLHLPWRIQLSLEWFFMVMKSQSLESSRWRYESVLIK